MRITSPTCWLLVWDETRWEPMQIALLGMGLTLRETEEQHDPEQLIKYLKIADCTSQYGHDVQTAACRAFFKHVRLTDMLDMSHEVLKAFLHFMRINRKGDEDVRDFQIGRCVNRKIIRYGLYQDKYDEVKVTAIYDDTVNFFVTLWRGAGTSEEDKAWIANYEDLYLDILHQLGGLMALLPKPISGNYLCVHGRTVTNLESHFKILQKLRHSKGVGIHQKLFEFALLDCKSSRQPNLSEALVRGSEAAKLHFMIPIMLKAVQDELEKARALTEIEKAKKILRDA